MYGPVARAWQARNYPAGGRCAAAMVLFRIFPPLTSKPVDALCVEYRGKLRLSSIAGVAQSVGPAVGGFVEANLFESEVVAVGVTIDCI